MSCQALKLEYLEILESLKFERSLAQIDRRKSKFMSRVGLKIRYLCREVID